MVEKSAISLVTTLVPFLLFLGSTLPFKRHLGFFSNYSRFVSGIKIIAGDQSAWLDGSCWSPLVSSSSISARNGAKKIRTGGSAWA
jgi:hypothetical protein